MKKQIKIKLKSYDHYIVDSSAGKIINLAKINNVTASGPIPLPVKNEKITILRATHKYKDSREQFERNTYTRLIYIDNPTEKIMKDLSNLVLPHGIKVDIKLTAK